MKNTAVKKPRAIIPLTIAAILLPGGLVLLAYLLLPFPPGLSARWLAGLGILLMVFEGLVWLQMRFFIRPTWQRLARRKKITWALASVGAALLFFAGLGPNPTQVLEKFPAMAPVEHLEVRVLKLAPGQKIDVWKVKIGSSRVDLPDLTLQGEWHEEGNHLWSEDPAASLAVTGRVPDEISISFWRMPESGQVEVLWDGQRRLIDRAGETTHEEIQRFEFDPAGRTEPPLSLLIRLLALPGWFALAAFTTGTFFE